MSTPFVTFLKKIHLSLNPQLQNIKQWCQQTGQMSLQKVFLNGSNALGLLLATIERG